MMLAAGVLSPDVPQAQTPPDAAPATPVQSSPLPAPGTETAPGPASPAAAEPSPAALPDLPSASEIEKRFSPDTKTRSEDDLLLFRVLLGKMVLAEDLPGFISGTSILLPLGEYVDVVGFPIDVDAADKTAKGWFIKENKGFSLDIEDGSVIIEGKKKPFDKSLVEIIGNEIYVDIRILPDWFPIEYSFDLSNLLLELKPSVILPAQLRAQREGYRKKVFGRPTTRAGDDLPLAESEPALLSVPVADVDITTNFAKAGSATSQTQNSYTVSMSGEYLYSSVEAVAIGAEKSNLSDLRVKLKRRDTDGNAMGALFHDNVPLPITEFSAGDVNPAQIPMTTRTTQGRGIEFSNAPLNRRTEFDRITLEGDIPQGWEVEIYRNEILIDFTDEITDDGRYKFEDVPLLFGRNVIKTVLYGPQGQTREKVEVVNVGDDQTPTGNIEYRIGLNEHDRRLLIRRENPDNDFEGRNRAVAEVRYGLASNLSVVGTFAHVPVRTNSQSRPYTYSGAGIRTSFHGILGRVDVVNQHDGGWAGKIAAQTRIFGISVSGEHDIYRRFISEQVTDSGSETLVSKSKVRFEGAIPQTVLPRIPISMDIDYERKESGSQTLTARNRLSAALGPFSISNTTTTRRRFNPDTANETTSDSSLLVNGRFNNWRIRGSAGYSTIPEIKLNSYNVTADWRYSKVYQPTFGFNRTFGTSRRNTYRVGLNATYPFVILGLNAEYRSDGNITARLNTSFSVSRDPNSGRVDVSSRDAGTSGMVAVRVFLDKDLNGKFSDGDQPLEGVGFRYASGSTLPGKTGKEGSLLLTGLTALEEARIVVDLGSLADPFWQADPAGVRVVPRAGAMISYEFPVVSYGEIDGTTWLAQPGEAEQKPLSRITVELLDESGKVVRSEKSAYDGFFLLDFIKPGKYTLRIKPEDLTEKNLTADQQYQLEISGDGTILNGQDFILKPGPEQPDQPAENTQDGGAKAPGNQTPGPGPQGAPAPATQPAPATKTP